MPALAGCDAPKERDGLVKDLGDLFNFPFMKSHQGKGTFGTRQDGLFFN